MDCNTPTEEQTALLPWARARFPNAVMRGEFLEQIRLWNRIEDLPRIEARTATNGSELEYWCADYRRVGLRKLIESYGGTLIFEPSRMHFEPRLAESAFELS